MELCFSKKICAKISVFPFSEQNQNMLQKFQCFLFQEQNNVCSKSISTCNFTLINSCRFVNNLSSYFKLQIQVR